MSFFIDTNRIGFNRSFLFFYERGDGKSINYH
nr:MAG TPA: hypothetical protein [Caudoviricetes sp.]